jgi:hypothetical protein
MSRWQKDPDRVGIRDLASLAQLPEGDRKECEAPWAEVQARIGRAQKTAS